MFSVLFCLSTKTQDIPIIPIVRNKDELALLFAIITLAIWACCTVKGVHHAAILSLSHDVGCVAIEFSVGHFVRQRNVIEIDTHKSQYVLLAKDLSEEMIVHVDWRQNFSKAAKPLKQ